MATNLFAPSSGQQQGGGGKRALVEFKAGKMDFNTSTGKVTPDKRKGLLQLAQGQDGLMHFIWKDRTSGTTEEDLIIFPEEAVFKRVKQCTTGRVFLLEFKASSRKLFFWSQEPKEDKDDENVTKLNDFINNPPAPGSQEGAPSGAPFANMPPGSEQAQMFQMFARPSGQQRATPPRGGQQAPGQQAPGQQGGVGISDLQSILSNFGMPASVISGALGTGQQPGQSQQAQQPAAGPRLNQVINAESLNPLLNDPALQQQLLPFLPEGHRNPEELNQMLRSPQFQQSINSFNDALASGQLGSLLQQFGLDPNATTTEAFLAAVQRIAQQGGQQQGQGEGESKKKDDDSMDTGK